MAVFLCLLCLVRTLQGDPAKLSIYIWVWLFPSPDSSSLAKPQEKGSKMFSLKAL